jgi:hypothetical protein
MSRLPHPSRCSKGHCLLHHVRPSQVAFPPEVLTVITTTSAAVRAAAVLILEHRKVPHLPFPGRFGMTLGDEFVLLLLHPRRLAWRLVLTKAAQWSSLRRPGPPACFDSVDL